MQELPKFLSGPGLSNMDMFRVEYVPVYYIPVTRGLTGRRMRRVTVSLQSRIVFTAWWCDITSAFLPSILKISSPT